MGILSVKGMAKILIIEDDRELAQGLRNWLSLERHTIELAYSGKDGLHTMTSAVFDLIILDRNLPEMSGIEICKAYRNERGQTPILMLTGMSAISDKTIGLDSGADDYLTKPFEPEELSARVRALLRREQHQPGQKLTLVDLSIDLESHAAFIGSKPIKLLPSEFALLEFLAKQHNGPPFTPQALLLRVWQDDERATISSVRTCVGQVRKKLSEAGSALTIEVIRGVGYRLQLAENNG